MDQLKSAERSASALVENARKERIDRMKEARTEVSINVYVCMYVMRKKEVMNIPIVCLFPSWSSSS